MFINCHKSCVAIAATLLISAGAYAQTTTSITHLEHQDSIERDVKAASLYERHFQLTQQEFERYQSLLPIHQALSGSDSPITPLEVLAIYASSEVERDRYLRRYAEIERQHLTAIFDTNRALKSIKLAMYDDQRLILPGQGIASLAGEFTLFFKKDDDASKAEINRLMRILSKTSHTSLTVILQEESQVPFGDRHAARSLVDAGRLRIEVVKPEWIRENRLVWGTVYLQPTGSDQAVLADTNKIVFEHGF
ncbi:MAG: hypothetical protein IBX55_10555 [Methyloprofundus sp.]|nr:hypothetical protein [Methyloprofundus sp.]